MPLYLQERFLTSTTAKTFAFFPALEAVSAFAGREPDILRIGENRTGETEVKSRKKALFGRPV